MSASLKAAEITVRVIVLALQLMAIIGGALLIGLYPGSNSSLINGIGGATIVVAAVVSIYEVLMIAFALIEQVNHPARLVVDIILNSVMAGLTVLTTMGVIVLAVILFIFLFAFGGIVIAIFALPIGLGVIYSIAFIVSAIAAGIIRSKLISEAKSSSEVLQPTPVVVAPFPGSQNFVLVQPPTAVGQETIHPPNYSAPTVPVASGPGANYNYNYQPGYQAGYPTGTGTDKNV